MLPQATAAESASMRSDAVAAGAVPLLANVLKDGRLLALLAFVLQYGGAGQDVARNAQPDPGHFMCIHAERLHANMQHISPGKTGTHLSKTAQAASHSRQLPSASCSR